MAWGWLHFQQISIYLVNYAFKSQNLEILGNFQKPPEKSQKLMQSVKS